jgi:hypothetical protein
LLDGASNWILFKYFEVQQSIKFDLQFPSPIKTFHSTMGNAPPHTVYTNKNRQHIPNWNILVNLLGDLLDEYPTW